MLSTREHAIDNDGTPSVLVPRHSMLKLHPSRRLLGSCYASKGSNESLKPKIFGRKRIKLEVVDKKLTLKLEVEPLS